VAFFENILKYFTFLLALCYCESQDIILTDEKVIQFRINEMQQDLDEMYGLE
jgi:hypothetical protein